MPENVLNDLTQANLNEAPPAGPNADAIIAHAAAQMNLPGVPVAQAPAAAPEGFDPAIHEVDAQGKPVPRSDGKGFKLKRGRKGRDGGRFTRDLPPEGPGAEDVPPQVQTVPAENVTVEPVRVVTKETAQASAAMIVNLAIGAGVMVFGEEWNPQDATTNPLKYDELASLQETLADYFVESQTDVQPGHAFLAFSAIYAARRAGMPNTRGKLAKWLGPLWGYVRGLFGRKA